MPAWDELLLAPRCTLELTPGKQALQRCCRRLLPPWLLPCYPRLPCTGTPTRPCRACAAPRRAAERVKAAVAELSELAAATGAGGRVVGLPCNVARPAEVAALADFAKSELGRLDLWINK